MTFGLIEEEPSAGDRGSGRATARGEETGLGGRPRLNAPMLPIPDAVMVPTPPVPMLPTPDIVAPPIPDLSIPAIPDTVPMPEPIPEASGDGWLNVECAELPSGRAAPPPNGNAGAATVTTTIARGTSGLKSAASQVPSVVSTWAKAGTAQASSAAVKTVTFMNTPYRVYACLGDRWRRSVTRSALRETSPRLRARVRP